VAGAGPSLSSNQRGELHRSADSESNLATGDQQEVCPEAGRSITAWDGARGIGRPKQGLGDPAFDIAWRDDEGVAFIGEVKSLTDENETGQIRLAIGQVLDYVHKLDLLRKANSLPPHWKALCTIRGVVAVERQPTKADHWTGLCEKHGIILTWPEKYDDTLANMH
jgi:hypothetical protein